MDISENLTKYLDQSYKRPSIEEDFKEFDLNLFLDKLIEIKDKYHFIDLSMLPSEDFDNLFVLYIPKNNHENIIELWDTVIDELEDYCETNNIITFFDNNGVVLRYR